MPVQNVGSGITAGQAQTVVTETVSDVPVEGEVTTVTSGQPAKVGDIWGGVEKKTAGNANASKDGNWGPTDNTGNNQVDSALDKFAAANAGNPAAIAACEAASAAVQANPQAYINADGSLNQQAFADLLTSSFAGVASVVVPSQEMILQEGSQAQGTGPSEGTQNLSAPTENVNAYNSGKSQEKSDWANGDIMAMAFIVMMEASKSAREDLKAIMDGVKLINKQKEGLRAASAELNKLTAMFAGKNDEYVVSNELDGSIDHDGSTGDPLSGLRDQGNGAFNMRWIDPNTGAPGAHSFIMNIPGPDGNTLVGGYTYTREDGGPLNKKDLDNIKEAIKGKLDSLSEMGEMESLRLQMAMDRMSKLMSTLSNMLKKASDTGQSITQNIK